MEAEDYYSLLQVDRKATQEEIRLAYKRLALDVHPDLSTRPDATVRMQQLNEAFAVLVSAERRAEYDRSLEAVKNPPAGKPGEDAWVVEWPDEAPKTAPVKPVKRADAPRPRRAPIDPVKQQELARKRRQWLLRQMKILAVAILLTVILFGWSLFAGEFTPVVVALLASPVLYVLFILIRLVIWPRG